MLLRIYFVSYCKIFSKFKNVDSAKAERTFSDYYSAYSFLESVEEVSQVALVVKNPPANAGDIGLILGSGRSPRVGNGNPLQYSCLENPMDKVPGGLLSMGSQIDMTSN